MNLVLALASLFAAVIPMFVYLLIIWLLDRNEREPFGSVLLYFIWGATGAIFLGIIGSILFQLPVNTIIEVVSGDNSEQLANFSGTVITAPLVEEFTKGLFLLIMINSKKFDGVVDGVVYGGAIGLGFGMSENFLYFISYGDTPESWLLIVIIRTFFSAVMHCMATSTFGAFIGFSKFRPGIIKFIFIPAGFFIAVLLHFTWNFTVSFDKLAVLGFLFLVMYGIAWLAMFQLAIYLESRTIIKELNDEAANGHIPFEHVKFIPYIFRRYKRGWCPPSLNQKTYVKTAVILAIRKYQYKNVSAIKQNLYLQEIQMLRMKIQQMLNSQGISSSGSSPSVFNTYKF
jgi:protease PrsW